MNTSNIILCSPERAQEIGGANSGKSIHVSEDTIMITQSILLQKYLRNKLILTEM